MKKEKPPLKPVWQLELFTVITGTNKPLRIIAGGHDVTDSMPLTRAALEMEREKLKLAPGACVVCHSKTPCDPDFPFPNCPIAARTAAEI